MSAARLRVVYPPSARIAEFEEAVVKAIIDQDALDPDWAKKAYDCELTDPLVASKDRIWIKFGQYVAREGFLGMRNRRIYSTAPQVVDFPRDRLAEAVNSFDLAGEGTRRRSSPAELEAREVRRQTDHNRMIPRK